MFKYLIKQPRHVWRSLGWRAKIESFLLIGLIYIFLIGKLHRLFQEWLVEDSVSPWGLTSFVIHLLIILVFASHPFINAYLLPRQKSISVFYTTPLQQTELLTLIAYFGFKYQLLNILLLIPVLFALLSAAGWIYFLAAFILFIMYLTIIVLFQNVLYVQIRNIKLYISINLLLLILLVALWGIVYWTTNGIWILDAILLASLFLSGRLLIKRTVHIQLEQIYPVNKGIFTRIVYRASSLYKRRLLLPRISHALFYKEWLSLWRNSHYRRLKWITLTGYILGLTLIYFSGFELREMWMLIFSMILIWLHYSNSFNEKYVRPDPEWYFKLIPVKFYQLWFSKFLAEFFLIFILLILFWLALIVGRTSLYEQLNMMGVCTIFSIFVLASMVNFKLIFYDDPRLAGYAFHFAIIFIVVMSINYYFVGPIIGMFLLIYYFYKSYRYFKA